MRIEALAQACDTNPFDAMVWLVTVLDENRTLVEVGIVQALRAGADLVTATGELFGQQALEDVRQVVQRAPIGSGDLVAAQVCVYDPAPDTAALVAYAFMRTMVALRAGAAHALESVLAEHVHAALGAASWPGGVTVHAKDVLARSQALVRSLRRSTRGLALVGA